MDSSIGIRTHQVPEGISVNGAFIVQASKTDADTWVDVPAYAVDVAEVNITANEFDKHPIAVASLDVEPGAIKIRAR